MVTNDKKNFVLFCRIKYIEKYKFKINKKTEDISLIVIIYLKFIK